MTYFVPTDLTPIQNSVILSLSSGSSITAAAEVAGISRTTIYSWLTKPEFAEALDHARADHTIAIRDELNDAALKAIRTLVAVMDDQRASATARVKAALAILNRPQSAEASWKLPQPVHPEAVRDAEATLQKAAFDETELNNSEQFSPISPEELVTPVRQPGPIIDPTAFNLDAFTFDHSEIDKLLNEIEQLTQKTAIAPAVAAKVGRNEPCPCGSGQKFKRCCLGKSQPEQEAA